MYNASCSLAAGTCSHLFRNIFTQAASIQDTSSRKLKLRLAILKGLFHRTETIYLYYNWTEINKEMNPWCFPQRYCKDFKGHWQPAIVFVAICCKVSECIGKILMDFVEGICNFCKLQIFIRVLPIPFGLAQCIKYSGCSYQIDNG
jgi:hypothetical protein